MSVTSATRLAAVLGWPVAHSKSPALHNAAFAASGVDAVYLALAVAPERLEAAVAGLRAVGALGASVTVPHKRAVLACCDRVDPVAARIGAVNCLELATDGALVGHNTDAAGFVDALQEGLGRSASGARAVLLGGGGAARAVAEGLREAGAGSIEVVARTPAKVDWIEAAPWTADELGARLAGCDLLVDCTSVGLSAESEARLPAPVPLEALPGEAAVATLVYHRETALLAAARRRGLATLDGAGMLVHQGARAFSIWTGLQAPIDVLWRAMRG